VVAIGPRFAEAVEGFLNSNEIGVAGAIEPGRYHNKIARSKTA